ncbi:hypothetical protein [Sediminitomix flava]|uniref:Lipocalin-like protein n=1 Tax=Sediminitomix flava TaxID=379075 RepID=A0A315Z8S6_SEDFL|nr:hypothetical protein [Sediminitomix flava]PWJ39946.1 hypothetical protein BC781_1059 [Sediminitomix flava]
MKANFLILFILSFYSVGHAQDVVGFWEFQKVTVGEEVMTPVAKWTKINADQSFESGNGWLQNGKGTWTFDKSTNKFTPTQSLGLLDEFGGFTVSFNKNKMIWTREEEGMAVVVTLVRIIEKPKSTADKVVGLWDLVEARQSDADILSSFDGEDKRYLFIRWDRIVLERNEKGEKSTGYWHMHGHKPLLTIMPHSEGKDAESWKVEVSDSTLKLVGKSASNKEMVFTYHRLQHFPN